MRATSLLAASALLLTAVAVLPSGQALQQPPQCQTITTCCGIEPAFAPCCIVPCVPDVADLPDLPGPPSYVVCVTEPCDNLVCDHAEDAVGAIHYEFTTSCGLVVTKTSPHCPSGPYKQAAAGPVMVRLAACAEADCDLRDATPVQVRPGVWGNDCTVDVEPFTACAPPSGHTIERRVLFVRVVLLVCDGGADPGPILS